MDNDELLMVTRRGVPIGITIPFSKGLVENGLNTWLAIKAFQNADLSLGQLAKSFKKSKIETVQVLNSLNIPLIHYDLNEDLQTIDKIF